MRVLIDSDVLMDFYLKRHPFAIDAMRIFTAIEQGKVKAFVTPVIVSNVYYLLRKLSTHQKIIKELLKLMQLVDVVHVDKASIVKALNSSFKDFEDALQNYASEQSNEIDVIVTRNTKDFKHSNIAVLAPADFINSIEKT